MRKAKMLKPNLNVTVQNQERSDTSTSESDSENEMTHKIRMEHNLIKDVLNDKNIVFGTSFETFARSQSMRNAIEAAPLVIVTSLLKRVRQIGSISEEACVLRKCLKARKNTLQKAQKTQERDNLSVEVSDSIEDQNEGTLEITVDTSTADKSGNQPDINTPGHSGTNTSVLVNTSTQENEVKQHEFADM